MLRRFCVAVAALCLAAHCFASVHAAINHQYKRWARATLTNDVDTVLSILSPTYTLRTFDGKTVSMDMYRASLLKRKAAGQKARAYATSIQSLSVTGNAAKVISLETMITGATDPITGKAQAIIHIHRYLDTWVNMSGAWKLQSTVTQLESTTIGKR